MPTEVTSLTATSFAATGSLISLEPVYNQFESLMLLHKGKMMPGLAEWVERTRESMPLQLLQKNRLVMEGLFYAFTTEGNLPSFGAFLDHLDSLSPQSFQDRMLGVYLTSEPQASTMKIPALPTAAQSREILSSADSYLAFLGKHFAPACLDLDVEAQAYRYVVDPPAMKALIIEHLREMWETYLAPEWARVRPMLMKTVDAFRVSDGAALARKDAIRFVIGRETPDQWAEQVEEAERVILAPSAHVGSSLGKFVSAGDLVILFGARLPDGVTYDEPDISRTDILSRLDALSDDHRLRILRLAADKGELRATDVMSGLDVSQSAASRSLTQLTATGYLVERRSDGVKCYSLNQERIQDTLGAIARYLGMPVLKGIL